MASDVSQAITYWNRKTGELREEAVLGDAAMRWAYGTLSGRICSPLLFATSLMSRLLGWYFHSRWSRRRIARTIADLGIDVTEFDRPPEEFATFSEFFTRHLKDGARPFPDDPGLFPSPADGRLLVYPEASGDTPVRVKGIEGPVGDLFDRPIDGFEDGAVAVVRLCPADYHRYHFPTDGTVAETGAIRGRYDSVNPVALDVRPRIFSRNKRAFTLIDTEGFGRIAFVEVGASGVSRIHQTFEGTEVSRGQEKGYFDFGGSTIVLAFAPGAITFDEDLVANSAKDIETLVRAGERIGRAV
jgi:phosphatidylserine decarboxylase